MSTNGHIPLSRFRILERTSASVPVLDPIEDEIQQALAGLALPPEKLKGRRIAVTAGSRGIASLQAIVRAICAWLKEQGAQPFVFPAMGSHGGATAEGQRKVLEEYGVTPEQVGAEIRSSMETVSLGTTAEGFRVCMDRNAWEADGVVVMNRIKPHTDFSGKIESGLLKILAVGMGKIDGATEVHIRARRFGLETVIRSISSKMLATGKILCGLSVVENELHQICAVRAARPENIAAQEEATLEVARTLVARIPFSKFQLLIVDQLGKNISGAGMDTKVIGRGVELRPGEAPAIEVIYVRDLTPETAGNAAGVGLADLIHERLYRKIDMEKTNINLRTSLNLPLTGVPIFLPSDRAALDLALGYLGSPEPPEQRIVWIRNTQSLNRIAISEPLAGEAADIRGWRMAPDTYHPPFDAEGDLPSPV